MTDPNVPSSDHPNSLSPAPVGGTKPPRLVVPGVFAFPPNRDTMGGTAYLIKAATDRAVTEQAVPEIENAAIAPPVSPNPSGNILVDAPPWNPTVQDWLGTQGGVRWLFITHRGAIGKAAAIQKALGCTVVMQEQEAYLLPQAEVQSFEQTVNIGDQALGLWTPGHSPGSACLYYRGAGGVLFSGRHLLPQQNGQPMPLRFAKTFHWPRQLASVQALRDRFDAESLAYLCPAANTGYLRGLRAVEHAYDQLQQIDLAALAQVPPGL
jgi:glyoxylase-like metal-dependent hydrolase (beta-lactamase superfamily II)